MNTLLATRPPRKADADTLFTSEAARLPISLELLLEDRPDEDGDGEGREGRGGSASSGGLAAEAVAGIPCLGITRDNFMSPAEKRANKISPDIYLTQRFLPPMQPRNPSAAAMRLLERVSDSAVGLWRNPLRLRIRNWKRLELMHVFNGFFHAAIDDPERYDTFSRNVTWPTFEM
jgi:hypothetical protein